jgi:hypothetical protein
MEVEHLADIHFIDVISAEDADVVVLFIRDEVGVLVDGVCAAAVPVFGDALLGGDGLDVLIDHAGEVPAARQVVV